MSKKIILAIFAVIVILFFFGAKSANFQNKRFVISSVTPESTPESPQEIKYDASTDLKKELDTVNPQINDSDFKE